MEYLLAFSIVFSIVYIMTPGFEWLSFKLDFLDRPTKRKKHIGPMPLLGGVGIFLGFICGYLVFIKPFNKGFAAIITASFLVLLIGMLDDRFKTLGKEFPVLPRLIVHIIAAIIVYSSGIIFKGFTNPFTGDYLVLPGTLQFILSIAWILGVTTVINWSDGVDGLAGSLSAISGSTLFIVALAKEQPYSAMLSIMVVGASLGFLKYNKYPAKIFMGDSGANFLGFILGVIALDGAFKQTTLISIFIPILALGVPIFDNIYVVIKRFLKGKPIYEADSSQIHHRLIYSGLNPKQVVAFLCLVSVCLSLLSIIILLLKV